MKKALLLITMFLLLGGCDVNPSKFGKSEAKSFTSKITYTKDHRTGLCFALVASRATGTASQTGMGISEVPCDFVEGFLE